MDCQEPETSERVLPVLIWMCVAGTCGSLIWPVSRCLLDELSLHLPLG